MGVMQPLLLPRGVQKGGWVGTGVTHLLALDASQPGEPRFALPNTPRRHTASTHTVGRPSGTGEGGSAPPYSPAAPAAATLAPAHPRAPRRDPAAARRGHGHRRTGRSPPARAGRGHGSGGARGAARRAGRGGQRDGHSPSPLLSRGCRGLPGEETEGLDRVPPAWAGWCSVSPLLRLGTSQPAPRPPPSPTLSPLGPMGPGLSWEGVNKERALWMLREDPALPSNPRACPQAPVSGLTETPSLPGAPGAPLGPGLPGSPVAPSIPSEMVGHTSHGSPCPRGQ